MTIAQVDAPRTDPIQRITEDLIAMIETIDPASDQLSLPWHVPASRALKPMNPLTGTCYRGINWLQLMIASGGARIFGGRRPAQEYPSARFATFRQWTGAGYRIRKGEHGHRVVFFKSWTINEVQDDGSIDQRQRKALRFYTVFAAEQVEGAEAYHAPASAPTVFGEHEPSERVLAQAGADIRYGFGAACYRWLVNGDRWIELPDRPCFESQEAFYAVAFHELVHWTKPLTGREAYLEKHFPEARSRIAFEELVAELGAAMLCGLTGISNTPRRDHAVYLRSWLEALRNERGFLMRAAAQAQLAVDWLAKRAGLLSAAREAEAAE